MAAEVGQPLAFLLGQMLRILIVGLVHGLPPGIGTGLVLGNFVRCFGNLVVIVDRVLGRLFRAVGIHRAFTLLQKGGVEELFFASGMRFEKVLEPFENLGRSFGIVPCFVERGEHAALAVVVGEDAVDNIHIGSISRC